MPGVAGPSPARYRSDVETFDSIVLLRTVAAGGVVCGAVMFDRYDSDWTCDTAVKPGVARRRQFVCMFTVQRDLAIGTGSM